MAKQKEMLCSEWPSVRLAGVLNRFRPRNFFLRNAVFRNTIMLEEEFIRWELVYRDRKMAPHCCPCDEAPFMSAGSFGSIMAEPSYVKAKTVVDACKPPARLNSSMPWMRVPERQRVEQKIIEDTRFLEDAVQLREEYMMSQILQKGSYTVTAWDQVEGTSVDKGTVDFKRLDHLSGHCFNWDKDSCDILGDLRRCAREVACESNAVIDTWLMGWRAHDKFMANKAILDALKCNANQNPRLFDIELDFTPRNYFGSTTYEGRVGQMDIWCSSDFWECDGKKNYFIHPDAVIGMSMRQPADEGMGATRLYGAIKIHDVLEPMERHLESWLTIDPSKRYEKIESAPMPILTNANGTCAHFVDSGVVDDDGGFGEKKIVQGGEIQRNLQAAVENAKTAKEAEKALEAAKEALEAQKAQALAETERAQIAATKAAEEAQEAREALEAERKESEAKLVALNSETETLKADFEKDKAAAVKKALAEAKKGGK